LKFIYATGNLSHKLPAKIKINFCISIDRLHNNAT
jgi:hypothetical protein